MKLKMKLTSTVAAFLLILGLTIMGVFALPTVNVSLKGKLTFTATNVNAKVTGVIAGTAAETQPTLTDLEFKAGVTTDVSSWENVPLEFTDAGSEITIIVTIENLAKDRPLYASINYADGFSGEVTKAMQILESSTAESGTKYEGGVIEIPTDTGADDNFAYIKLTMEVTNKNASLSKDATWGYAIDLKDASVINSNYIKNLSFTVLDETAKTVSVSMKSKEETKGDIVIPSYVVINPVNNGVTMASADTNLENVYKVTNIGYGAFLACKAITSVTIPNTVTSIGDYAFQACAGLTSIVIPDSVTSIGHNAFVYCRGIESISIGVNNTVYEDRGLNAIVEKSTDTLIQGCNKTKINNTIKAIREYAFAGCEGFSEITIPDSVTSIGESAFTKCLGLTTIQIPGSITCLEKSVFRNCSELTSIIIPTSVTSIKEDALNNCDKLNTINYMGTEEQWNAVAMDYTSHIILLNRATIVFNYTVS